MEAAAGIVDANSGPDGLLRIAVQVWAEAQRDPALAALGQRIYGQIVVHYEQLADRARERGELPADADPAVVGPALAALVLGYGLLRLMTGGPRLDAYRAGLRAVLGHHGPGGA